MALLERPAHLVLELDQTALLRASRPRTRTIGGAGAGHSGIRLAGHNRAPCLADRQLQLAAFEGHIERVRNQELGTLSRRNLHDGRAWVILASRRRQSR